MPKTHLKAKAVDIGEVELGDHLFLIIEVDVDEERKKNTKTGTTETLYADVKDVLRLVGALPGELVEELRRQRREAEEKAAGIPIIPGLEGFLDASGVVVTEADVPEKESPKAEAVTSEPGSKAAPAIEVDVDVARWVELGVDVHNLRALAAEDPGEVSYTARLEELFAELNSLLEGDEVIEDGGEVIIIDVEGEIRTTIALPDIELVDDPEGEVEVTEPAESTEEPFEGYDLLDFDGIIEHVVSYLDADKAFGGG